MNLTYIIREKYRTRQTYTAKKRHIYMLDTENFVGRWNPQIRLMCKDERCATFMYYVVAQVGVRAMAMVPCLKGKGKEREENPHMPYGPWVTWKLNLPSPFLWFCWSHLTLWNRTHHWLCFHFSGLCLVLGSVIYSAPQHVRGKGHNQHLFLPHQVIPRLGLGGGGGGHSGVVGAFGHHMTWLK